MWFVAHAAIGGALGAWIKKPLVVVAVVAVLSHALFDLIPHWDYTGLPGVVFYTSLDVISGLLLLSLLMIRNRCRVATFLGGIFAGLPDLEGVLEYFGYLSVYYYPSHLSWFPHGKSGMFWGVLVQAVVILVAIAVVRRNAS